MITYKKSISYVCLVLLIVGGIACKREARQATEQTCTVNEKAKAAVETERPVLQVVFDDKALIALSKQKATAVYCIAMGAS
jgi:putative lipoprotein